MGPLFALIFWCLVLAFVASAAVVPARRLAQRLSTRAPMHVQAKFLRAATLLPSVCAVYLLIAALSFGIYGTVTGRDLGFGDDMELPLQNGYRWLAVDLPTLASIRNRSQVTAVDDVVSLQQSGDWLAGATSKNSDWRPQSGGTRPDAFFLLNTKSGQLLELSTSTQLSELTAQHGFALHLQPSSDFYNAHRYGWRDALALFLILAPGLIAIAWLYRKARRLLRSSAANTGPYAPERLR